MSPGPWRIEIDPRALKDLRKLSRPLARDILRFIDERLLASGDPKPLGKPLRGDLKGFWRYRFGDFRIIARIDDGAFVILVIAVGHRREIYR